MSSFESDVLDSLSKSCARKSRNAFSSKEFDSLVDRGLNFDSLKKIDPTAKVSNTGHGYLIQHSSRLSSMDAYSALLGDNNIDLSFTEEMVNFSPDEGMVKSSAAPLWIIKRVNADTISIVRAWR